MKNLLALGLLSLVVEKVYSQVGPWERCGGIGYTGSTICSAGYTCHYFQEWYSQCIPGEASSTTASTVSPTPRPSTTIKKSTTTKKSTTSSTSSTSSKSTSKSATKTITTASSTPSATASGVCSTSFTPVSAAVAIEALQPGWNLGNTLDAVPNEGSWNNPPAQLVTLQQIKAKGFNSVRIPTTWAYHFDDASPTWNVNKTWMDRVETVVDQALATGFWVVLNVHHDSWIWMDLRPADANFTLIEEKFGRLWAQIGARFKCKSSKLILEAINEPAGDTEAHGIELNKLNDIFLTEVNKAGGNNPKRVLSLGGLGHDGLKTTQWFKRGSLYPDQPWALQFHYYSPYDFIFNAWGRTIWGSASDKASMTNDFAIVASNFSGIPTFIGEWDASTGNTEPAARWKYFDYFASLAKQYGFSHIIWDNGLDHFDRAANTWRDPVAVDILFNAVAGTKNALADSTTDQSATSQSSSAFLFHKVGDPVTDQSVSYMLNGNTLTSIKNKAGTTLSSSDASLASDGTLTLSASYLATLYTSTAAAGIKDVLTLDFTPGASLTLTIVQYDTPTAATTTFSLATLSGDMTIPLNYAGLPVIAAIKAVKADGTYPVDDWTQWLGPLQQGRWTTGSWAWSDQGFVLYQAGIDMMKGTGQTVTLTLEFYPRSLGQNSLTLTFAQ